jgi:hypothetical protein
LEPSRRCECTNGRIACVLSRSTTEAFEAAALEHVSIATLMQHAALL